MRNIEAVIFDWAGTTVDYGCMAPVQAFVKAFEKFGITPTEDEVRKPMGMLKRDHVRTMMNMDRIHQEWIRVHGKDFTEDDVDQVYQESESGILDILHDYAEPKPYVINTIKALRDAGIKIGSTTGYTDEMMGIVVPKAAEFGYAPDCWFSPNSVKNMGRPYPYMIFRNMETLGIHSVANVIKVGDTVSDIKEGISAGVITVGVTEGSSVMGLSQDDYERLTETEQNILCDKTGKIFKENGADHVIRNMSEFPGLIRRIEAR